MKSKYNCTNTHCYITDETLSPNETFEHIIPNALGGFLKSNKLVLSRINTGLFDKLDAELANRIEIAPLFKFKRDRGQQPPIKGTTKDGIEYLIHEGTKVTMLSRKPEEILDNEGKWSKFPAHQKDEMIAAHLKKNPNLKIEDIKYKEEHFESINPMSYKYGLSIIKNSIDSFRAIAKIGTNYAVYNNIKKSQFLDFISFIKGDNNLDKIKLGYFYPKQFLKYQFGEKECSHILHLKGSKKNKVLYCYVELFNLHCFMVILNQHYEGDDFTKTYIWDVQNRKELLKSFDLDLTEQALFGRPYIYYKDVVKDYTERLTRLDKVLDLKIRFDEN